VIYIYMDKFTSRLRHKKSAQATAPPRAGDGEIRWRGLDGKFRGRKLGKNGVADVNAAFR